MKTKPVIFALGLCLLLLSGCVASIGPEYGYYPPAQPYYGYGRSYYAPRPVLVRPPYYRQSYRSNYGGGYRGNGGYGGRQGGGNAGGSIHGRSR